MSRTVTALYDTRAEAEAARRRLSSAVDVENVKVIDGQSQDSGGGGLGDHYLSNDDRHAYGEALRRGGALLCAEVDGDADRDRIVQALEETPGIDLEERQRSWQQEGWTPYSQAREGSGQGFAGSASGAVEEERIPIVDEELRVGKREIERGGARVRSYVREVPVREEVTLREEHVQVERRPVDQAAGTAATATDDMLRDRTIEMVERAEEAVVQKVANVREEVVVTKTAEERTEQIQDTVRRTEVDVEDGREAGDRSAFGGFGGNSGSGGSSAR
ncbi:MAG: hypothetical protein QOG72_1884 [Sphingomonadales bacterium]|jgi:uncharacterized protein (TIGR02271 family)|nr:hypothetical protein [Sphingomonadales bacterium]